jgi:hypothetical protein
VENKHDAGAQRSMTSQINVCQSGSFPTLVEEVDNENKFPHKNTGKTDEKVQDTGLAFDDDLALISRRMIMLLWQWFIQLILTISSML